MNKRSIRGSHNHRTVYKRTSGKVRTLISRQELSESALVFFLNGAGPSANIRKMARPVWLVPYYTESVDKACTSFKVIEPGEEGYDHRFGIPTDSESQWGPCLISIRDKDIQSKVSHVQLVWAARRSLVDDIRRRFMATGFTDCISSTDKFLYLMWK